MDVLSRPVGFRSSVPVASQSPRLRFSGSQDAGQSPKPETIYSFGTSGYRNDTDEGFNGAVVRQITAAISDYLITEMERTGIGKPVLIGGDTRDKTKRYIPVIADMLRERGLDVYVSDGDVPSPVLAYAASHFRKIAPGVTETAGAILMTASHNPWPYGGYNFLTGHGAVAPTEVSSQFVENQKAPKDKRLGTFKRLRLGLSGQAKIRKFDPYDIYRDHIKNSYGIDYAKIRESGVEIFYDPMYATGRRYLSRMLQEEGIPVTSIHDTDRRPAGYQGMPEPREDFLGELKDTMARSANPMKIGLATDGDADRFGVLDEKGNFVSSNDVLALLTHHLIRNRGERGAIVRNQATSHFLDAVARREGLAVQQTPVGYKYLAHEIMEGLERDKPVLLAGESSGGVSVLNHIPEKDGVLANLLIAELVATEGKPLSRILKEIKAALPEKFSNRELIVYTDKGQAVLDYFTAMAGQPAQLAGIPIDAEKTRESAKALQARYGTRDGVKIYLKDGSWVLVRKSGTEPLMRVFVEAVAGNEADAREKAVRLHQALNEILTRRFDVPGNDIIRKD